MTATELSAMSDHEIAVLAAERAMGCQVVGVPAAERLGAGPYAYDWGHNNVVEIDFNGARRPWSPATDWNDAMRCRRALSDEQWRIFFRDAWGRRDVTPRQLTEAAILAAVVPCGKMEAAGVAPGCSDTTILKGDRHAAGQSYR